MPTHCKATPSPTNTCTAPRRAGMAHCERHSALYRELVEEYRAAADVAQRIERTIQCYHATDLAQVHLSDLLRIPIHIMADYMENLEREIRCRREHNTCFEGGSEYRVELRLNISLLTARCGNCIGSERHLSRLHSLEITLKNTKTVHQKFKERHDELCTMEKNRLSVATQTSEWGGGDVKRLDIRVLDPESAEGGMRRCRVRRVASRAMCM